MPNSQTCLPSLDCVSAYVYLIHLFNNSNNENVKKVKIEILFFNWKVCTYVTMYIIYFVNYLPWLCVGIPTDSSFVPPLIYAMMGSSRDVAVGTVAVASLLIAAMLGKEVSPTQQTKQYVELVFTATFFSGVFQASLGFLRSHRLSPFYLSIIRKDCILRKLKTWINKYTRFPMSSKKRQPSFAYIVWIFL